MSGALAVIATGAPELGATVNTNTLFGYRIGTGTIGTSGPGVVTAYGGRTPYTYLWTYVSGSASIYANTPTVASSYFSCYFASAGGNETAVYKCVVTDAAATVVDTANIEISIESL